MTNYYVKTLLYFLFCFYLKVNTLAQNDRLPARIERKTEKYTETNSKYGSQTRKKTYFEVVFKDSTREVLTNHSLKDLIKTVPEARVEWQKYKANSFYKAGSLPLLAMGFIGAIQFIDSDAHKKRNATISVLGLASGAWVFFHFDHQKKRNQNNIVNYCNKRWSYNSPKSELKNVLSPDIMRIGAVHENAVGVGFTWYFKPSN